MKRHGPIWAALTPRGLAELLGCSGNPAVPHAQVLLHSHAPAKIRRSRPLLHTKRAVAACTGVFTAHNTPARSSRNALFHHLRAARRAGCGLHGTRSVR